MRQVWSEDPKTNLLKFEWLGNKNKQKASRKQAESKLRLRGEGAMPTLALSGPLVFGDAGGQHLGPGRLMVVMV